jgi:hypothetical protein
MKGPPRDLFTILVVLYLTSVASSYDMILLKIVGSAVVAIIIAHILMEAIEDLTRR